MKSKKFTIVIHTVFGSMYQEQFVARCINTVIKGLQLGILSGHKKNRFEYKIKEEDV